MKPSRYNYYVPTKKKDMYVLYNTLSGAIFSVDKELRETIQKNPSALPEEAVEDFKKEWILLDDDMDELRAISNMRDEMRFNAPWLQFMILTTYDCNLSCPYCYEKKDPMTSIDKHSCERIKRFIEKSIERHRPTSLEFLMYGGEPLLNPEPMIELIDHFTEYCLNRSIELRVDMTTNGTLITEDIIAELEKYPVYVIQVTLDGPKKMHNEKRVYKNGKGTYEDIIKGLHLLRTSKLRPKIRINVDEINKDAIPELLDDLKERGLADVSIYFGIIRALSKVCESYAPSCMEDSEIKSVIPSLWRTAIEKGFTVPLKILRNLVGCGMQSNADYTIDPEGHIYKCVTGVGYPDQRIGTIDEKGDIPMWNPVYFKWMSRNPLQFPACRACKFFPLCGGGCPMIALTRYGTFEAGGCFETKNVLKEQLMLYLEQTYPEKFV